MLLRLSKNAFVRQYGEFTYVLERIADFDSMYCNADVFMRWIGREARDEKEILANICAVYDDVEKAEIVRDFHEFIATLIENGVVIAGESEDDIEKKEISFSYDVDSPKTMAISHINPDSQTFETVPQEVLGAYFKKNPTIFTLQIDITQACTERCVHCYIPEYNPVFLPLVNIKRVIDEFRGQGGISLSLSGGECMLHPDFKEIVRYARSQDLIVGILSNLTLCDDSMVELLVEAEATVQVSLYSMDPETHDHITQRRGSFAKTKTAIEKLRKAHVPCRISCPTMKANYRDYIGVIEYARSLKMDAQTDFVIMGKMDGDTSNLACRLSLEETRSILEDILFKAVPVNSEYFNPAKKDDIRTDEEWGTSKVCGACVDSVCLDATGNYYPCPAFGGIKLGSCYEHDLRWIWNSSPETLRIRGVTGKDFPKCLHCKDRDYCSVCMCRNYNETGDVFTPARHFCDVARVNHEVVDSKFTMMAECRKVSI